MNAKYKLFQSLWVSYDEQSIIIGVTYAAFLLILSLLRQDAFAPFLKILTFLITVVFRQLLNLATAIFVLLLYTPDMYNGIKNVNLPQKMPIVFTA
jgi:hypothetical protein